MWDFLQSSQPAEFHLCAGSQCSQSLTNLQLKPLFFPAITLFFSFFLFSAFVYPSVTQLPMFLIPSMNPTVFFKCLVDSFTEYNSTVETTAHLLSFAYPLLISSPFFCCSISFIPVLTGAHFRWSVLLRHVPFSSAGTRFFF